MSDRSMGQRRKRSLSSLITNASGNTLAMMAIAMIPMSAMAGSAIDMSRLYVVKVRLQQACDAGALAGRKFMTGTTLDANAAEQAHKFFDSNFPEGWFSTTDVEFDPEATSDSQVTATATATVPMAIMHMFGKDPVELEVSCDAKLEIANADIMFVLDTTGSMACAASDSTSTCDSYVGGHTTFTGGRWQATEKEGNSRIEALRKAVLSFYDTIDSAVDDEAQLRFGFVPYSAAVNLGVQPSGLLLANYLVNDWTYQSREFQSYAESNSTNSQSGTKYLSTYSQCQTWSNNSGSNPVVSGGPAPTPRVSVSYELRDYDSGSDRCRRYERTTTTTYTARWTYKPVTYDVSQFKLGNSVTTRTGNNGTNVSSTWNGCIEERDTDDVSTVPSSLSNMPDLDIDRVPDSDGTRWRPAWPQIIYNRPDVSPQTNTTTNYSQPSGLTTACPKRAQRVEKMTKDQVRAYVYASDFIPHGYTYHDIGLIWGARLLSPTGIFGAHNTTTDNGREIARHIIFMTDGDMKPQTMVYGTYGLEDLDRRVTGGTPSDADLKLRHNARFNRLCVEARNKNITLWVIAYAQTMTSELRNCATPGKAYYASNDAQLTAAFQQIAQQIADLRLSK